MPDNAALYNSVPMRRALGNALRPGGMASTRRFLEQMPPAAGARVLDAGCGPGRTAAFLHSRKRYQVFGLDRDIGPKAQIEPAQPGLAYICADISHLPLASSSLDAVFCECVLSLLADPDRALAELYRCLRPGGLLYFSDIYHRDKGAVSAHGPGRTCLAASEDLQGLRQSLTGHGFKVVLEEDQTVLMRQTAARLVFEYGSLQVFWETVLGAGCQHSRPQARRMQSLKPGYVSFVLSKEDEHE